MKNHITPQSRINYFGDPADRRRARPYAMKFCGARVVNEAYLATKEIAFKRGAYLDDHETLFAKTVDALFPKILANEFTKDGFVQFKEQTSRFVVTQIVREPNVYRKFLGNDFNLLTSKILKETLDTYRGGYNRKTRRAAHAKFMDKTNDSLRRKMRMDTIESLASGTSRFSYFADKAFVVLVSNNTPFISTDLSVLAFKIAHADDDYCVVFPLTAEICVVYSNTMKNFDGQIVVSNDRLTREINRKQISSTLNFRETELHNETWIFGHKTEVLTAYEERNSLDFTLDSLKE